MPRSDDGSRESSCGLKRAGLTTAPERTVESTLRSVESAALGSIALKAPGKGVSVVLESHRVTVEPVDEGQGGLAAGPQGGGEAVGLQWVEGSGRVADGGPAWTDHRVVEACAGVDGCRHGELGAVEGEAGGFDPLSRVDARV